MIIERFVLLKPVRLCARRSRRPRGHRGGGGTGRGASGRGQRSVLAPTLRIQQIPTNNRHHAWRRLVLAETPIGLSHKLTLFHVHKNSPI